VTILCTKKLTTTHQTTTGRENPENN